MLTWLICLAGITAYTQQSNTFYMMHKVPQTNLLNPAVQIDCRWYVGVPLLTSAHLSYSNTAFTYNDLAGSDTWNLEGVTDQMHRRDLYNGEVAIPLISLGYKRRTTYYTFHIMERGHVYSVVPGNLARMVVYGNAPLAGDLIRVRPFRPGGIYHREYAAGISKTLFQGLTVGIRGKLIFGKAGFYPGTSDMRFTTEETTFDLLLEGDYHMNSSFPLTLIQDEEGNVTGVDLEEIDPAAFLLNRGNPGFGIDLGVVYRPDERTVLSASLLDLGVVRWRRDLNKVRVDGQFEYRGVDSDGALVSFDFLEQMIDSLLNSMQTEVSRSPFFSPFPAQLFLGGTTRLSERLTVGLVNRNLIFRSKLHSSFTAIVQTELADRLFATASWSYLNNSLANVGAGLAYTGRGFQFHLVSDNLIGFFFPFDTRTLNLRVGMNLLLGCPGGKKKPLPGASYGPMPVPPNCGNGLFSGDRQRKLERAARRTSRK